MLARKYFELYQRDLKTRTTTHMLVPIPTYAREHSKAPTCHWINM